MGARRFAPGAARFLQQDLYLGALENLTLSTDPLTQNRYALAGGAPTSYVETDGHVPAEDGAGNTGHFKSRRPQFTPNPNPITGRRSSQTWNAYVTSTQVGKPSGVEESRSNLPAPPSARLKVPDPGQSLLSRLFGRNYVTPEEAANVVLELGGPSGLWRGIGRVFVGAESKLGPASLRQTPGGGVFGGLWKHEGKGRGHTIAEHVARSDAQLLARLQKRPNIPGASTFTSQAVADDAVSAALIVNSRRVEAFLKSDDQVFAFSQEFNTSIGRSILRGETVSRTANRARIVLFKDNSNLSYHIRTAFPDP